ncbi:Meiotic nuclear division protein 1 [Coemansia sp. RSA 486]|nr:Meiotic nuclear division protein 1 [Coemansia sp. RSA 486]
MPKPKKFKLAASFKQLQTQKAKLDAARKSQQHRDQQEGMKKPTKPIRKPRFPYTTSNTILLIGEGNFSFAHSLATQLGTARNIVATAYDSSDIVDTKYSDAREHIAAFEAMGGEAMFDVDATALGRTVGLKNKVFSHIVFNFPHAGAGIKDQERNVISNQKLLMGFFASAMPLLVKRSANGKPVAGQNPTGADDDDDDDGRKTSTRSRKRKKQGNGEVFEFEGAQATVTYSDNAVERDEPEQPEPVAAPGQIHVTLKSGPPYSLWNVRQLAKDSGLSAYSTVPFDLDAFPGYEHRRTLGFKDGVSASENHEIRNKDPKIYMFVVRQEKPVDGAGVRGDEEETKRRRVEAMGPRLTIDEKRKRMMEIFHDTMEPYLLKELEKIGPKQKGIVSQTVKDVVQSLVDDNMVRCEKIGTSNYFWSFPSESALKRKTRLQDLQKEVLALETKQTELEQNIEQAMLGREQTEERKSLVEELTEVEQLWNGQQEELRQFRECDPELMAQRKKQAVVAKDAANRWTDNIFIIQGWVRDKFNMDPNDFNKHFGIPADFDNL